MYYSIHELIQQYPIIGLIAIIALILILIGLYIFTFFEEKQQNKEKNKD